MELGIRRKVSVLGQGSGEFGSVEAQRGKFKSEHYAGSLYDY